MCILAQTKDCTPTVCFNLQTGKVLDFASVDLLDRRLKNEGYANGLGTGNDYKAERFSIKPYLLPTLSYSSNINGGNPGGTLVLGAFSFKGDEELVRKKGALIGLNAGLGGRLIYGEGRYLKYNVLAIYDHSPRHDIGIKQVGVGFCSKNHIYNWWYLDVCGNSNAVERELTEDKTDDLSISAAKIFSSSSQIHHRFTFGANRHFSKEYNQDQFLIGIDTLLATGMAIGINLTFGAKVENQLAVRKGINASLGTLVARKPLRLSVSYSEAKGGRLLGFQRDETTLIWGVSYSFHPKVSLTFSQKETDSSINYFDANEPSLGLQYSLKY